jgi:two-component system, LytTR family, response regulator LytT
MNTASNPDRQRERLRALVVEDEWPARNYLVELIEASGLAEVVGAVADADEARQVLHPVDGVAVDVVFVDVQLAGSGSDRAGLDWVRAEIQGHRPLMFVIATAFEHHAIEAFELGVVDYLLKPFSEDRVKHCLLRLRSRQPRTLGDPGGRLRIVSRRKKSLVFLEPDEIWAFEAAERMTFAHTEHGTFDLDLSLTAIETSFGRTFIRVHRSWLVNLRHVKELERDGNETRLFVGKRLSDGGEGQGIFVQVARDRTQEVRDLLLANSTGLRRL